MKLNLITVYAHGIGCLGGYENEKYNLNKNCLSMKENENSFFPLNRHRLKISIVLALCLHDNFCSDNGVSIEGMLNKID